MRRDFNTEKARKNLGLLLRNRIRGDFHNFSGSGIEELTALESIRKFSRGGSHAAL
jgi:hypothetical protein